MAVGKFYDNFHDLPAKQNQFNLYEHNDEDDPSVWTTSPAPMETQPKVYHFKSFHFD